MGHFRDYERTVIQTLVDNKLPTRALNDVLNSGALVSLAHTGVGYFLTVRHHSIPEERVVCSEPLLTGESDGVECGFVVFLERSELTLECHAWGDQTIPESFRDQNVKVYPAKGEDV